MTVIFYQVKYRIVNIVLYLHKNIEDRINN